MNELAKFLDNLKGEHIIANTIPTGTKSKNVQSLCDCHCECDCLEIDCQCDCHCDCECDCDGI